MLLKAERAKEAEAIERERLRDLHKSDVQNMMARTFRSDSTMRCYVCFGSWHKLISDKCGRSGMTEVADRLVTLCVSNP